MRATFKIQRIQGDKASQCSWPHWFRMQELKRLRAELDETIASKERLGDGAWPYVYELNQQKG